MGVRVRRRPGRVRGGGGFETRPNKGGLVVTGWEQSDYLAYQYS